MPFAYAFSNAHFGYFLALIIFILHPTFPHIRYFYFSPSSSGLVKHNYILLFSLHLVSPLILTLYLLWFRHSGKWRINSLYSRITCSLLLSLQTQFYLIF